MSVPKGFLSADEAMAVVRAHVVNPIVAARKIGECIRSGTITAWAEKTMWRDGQFGGLDDTGGYVDPALLKNETYEHLIDLQGKGVVVICRTDDGVLVFERNMWPLFVHEEQLLRVWARTQAPTPVDIALLRKTGPSPVKGEAIKARMRRMSVEALASMKVESMKLEFGAASSTCTKARKEILAEHRLNSGQTSNIGK